MNSILIAGISSGSGKTTVTIGLLRALSRKGVRVQPFKCGPDYIDPQYHAIASGRDSVNLDPWMNGPEHVRGTFRHYAGEADVNIIEGVMGLYDGTNGLQGSSAEVAELLDVPVVLVVNTRSMAHSLAPLLHGYLHYRPQTRIAGVILGQVGSERHEAMLLEAAREVGMPVLGVLPRLPELYAPSRHLGLDISQRERISELADRVADNYKDTGLYEYLHC